MLAVPLFTILRCRETMGLSRLMGTPRSTIIPSGTLLWCRVAVERHSSLQVPSDQSQRNWKVGFGLHIFVIRIFSQARSYNINAIPKRRAEKCLWNMLRLRYMARGRTWFSRKGTTLSSQRAQILACCAICPGQFRRVSILAFASLPFRLGLSYKPSLNSPSSAEPPALNCTLAFRHVIGLSSLVTTVASTVYVPGGICAGRSTSFVSVRSPFFSGHSRSTFATVSQRSAVECRMVMTPYLTVYATLAPCSTSSARTPVAATWSFVPLREQMGQCGGSSEEAGKLGSSEDERTYALGGLGSRSTFLMARMLSAGS